jgi:hypothetical protein
MALAAKQGERNPESSDWLLWQPDTQSYFT